MKIVNVACDYLVVGAGAASLSFIDSLLTEQPSAKIVLVDKNPAPGGHWVHAYGFVRLHQPSLLYGVASRQLEGNWLKLTLLQGTLPWNHRASKPELLTYFNKFVQDKVTANQLEYYPSCVYNFETHTNGNNKQPREFLSLDGNTKYVVDVRSKLVNGIMGECIVPSQNPPEFPVDRGIHLLTPNQVFDGHVNKELSGYKKKHFVVLGNGKTAMDTVVYLQRAMKLRPNQISWVISNDVWMLSREGGGNPWSWPQALLENDGNPDNACLALEKKGAFVRLDPKITPTKFRFPVVGKDELQCMRRIQNTIRRGRVTAIRETSNNHVSVEFGKQDAWVVPNVTNEDLVFVHCTSPGPFNGKHVDDLFDSDNEMTLDLMYAPPVSISMSVMGYLEAARIKGNLDIEFGKRLLGALDGRLAEETHPGSDESAASKEWTENEVLRRLIKPMPINPEYQDAKNDIRSISNMALFFALCHKDPMTGYKWLQQNRLSFFSIPGFKGLIYENMGLILEKAKEFGYSEGEIQMMTLVREKLEVLKGM